MKHQEHDYLKFLFFFSYSVWLDEVIDWYEISPKVFRC